MRLLLITDQEPQSRHSAIRGLFDRHLRAHAEVDIVWFSRTADRVERHTGHIVLPWRYRRHPLLWRLFPPVDLAGYDFVMVRNLFPVLSALQGRGRPYRLGFWESFPHRFRRFYEAQLTGKALWRKSLEYRWHARKELLLVSACDFYCPITSHYRDQFRPQIAIPTLPLPMGIEESELPPPLSEDTPPHTPLRLLYVGAVDKLRDFETILQAVKASRIPVVLDIFTPSDNAAVRDLQAGGDRAIRLHPALPREQLLARMRDYDAGLSLIPPTPLYAVASPTKSMEYFAMGLPALMTRLPEHETLFGELSFLFTPFDAPAIAKSFERLAALPLSDWRTARQLGRTAVLSNRSYRRLAVELTKFLSQILPCR